MRRIAISAGHSSHVRGASDVLDEFDENVRVVNRVTEFLRSGQVPVVSYIDTVSTTQDENLERLVNWHNQQTRDLDVSIHFNANKHTSKPVGTECWYYSQEQLANEVATEVARASDLIDRGPKHSSSLYFLNNTSEPAILIEVCFVDSTADAQLYERNFDPICEAIATTISGMDVEAPGPLPPEPEGALFHVKGPCSWFGGPEDTGVSASEGLAFLYAYGDAPHLFLPQQPSGTTGLARRLNPRLFYVACRWDYDITNKDMLARPSYQALVRANGMEFYAWPADWGPHEDTDRVADLSPALLDALQLGTDDIVEVIYPAPSD